jgi:hypothetical protein
MSFIAAATGRIMASNSHKFPANHLNVVCAFAVIFCLAGAFICYNFTIDNFPEHLKSATLAVFMATAIVLPLGVAYMQVLNRHGS